MADPPARLGMQGEGMLDHLLEHSCCGYTSRKQTTCCPIPPVRIGLITSRKQILPLLPLESTQVSNFR